MASSVVLLASLLGLAVAVCAPGLTGGFLFDDFPNLELLGTFGGVTSFDGLYSYLVTGSSGPTGRPLSLLSFLLDDFTWPSQAYGFKRTNLLIHLLTGLVICWTMFRLLCLTGRDEARAAWVAVIGAGFWLLHPYFISTTFYVVQRMAQLATLFAMAGLLGYLHGRSILAARPRAGYVWMSVSLGLGTLLAVLSKENGALLPMLVLMVEVTVGHVMKGPRPDRRWTAAFLWLPSLALLGYLVTQINLDPNAWPHRAFSQPERLLSEARIVWEYLYYLFVPHVEGRGLFQDGYRISTGWLAPPATLAAVFGIVGLAAFGWWIRKRLPFLSLAILFFLAGHLLESTVIGLELYFEHRNYLPAVFLFLPVALGVERLGERFRFRVGLVATLLLFTLLAWTTYHRAALWGDTERLQLYWATNTPDSPRAQNAIANVLLRQGRSQAAITQLEAATTRLPDSPLLTIRLLIHKVGANTATEADFIQTAERLRHQAFDAQAIKALDLLVEVVTSEPSRPNNLAGAHHVLTGISQNEKFSRLPLFMRFVPYLEARLFVAENQPGAAYEQFQLAMSRYSETDAALSMVADMARGGYYREALGLLDEAEAIFRMQPVRTLKRPAAIYIKEIARLRRSLLEEWGKRERSAHTKTETAHLNLCQLGPIEKVKQQLCVRRGRV